MCGARTRSLGDADLKQAGVVAEPEVTVTALGPADSFLILASDGLWDVVPDQDAVGLVLDTGAPRPGLRRGFDVHALSGAAHGRVHVRVVRGACPYSVQRV